MPDSDNENTEPEINEETTDNQDNNSEVTNEVANTGEENEENGEENEENEEENEEENDGEENDSKENDGDVNEGNNMEQNGEIENEGNENNGEENDCEENDGDVNEGDKNESEVNDGDESEINDGDESEVNDGDESEGDTETTEEEIQFFKATIKDYLQIEEEIKVLQKGISQRRKKKNNLSDIILTFLQEKDISHVNLQGNFAGKQMKCNNKVSKAKLSDAEIRNVFNEFFKDDEMGDNKVEQLMDIMESKKKVKEVSKLEINKIGGRKKKNASEQLSSIINDTSEANEDSEAIPEHLQYLYNT